MRRGRSWAPLIALGVAALLALAACAPLFPSRAVEWTPDELAQIQSLWIGALPPVPPDPSNRYADDPRAAALGERIFFDARFSANGQVSCATCHQPDYGFTDRLPRGQGIALSRRRTMTLTGAAYAPFLFWDGRKDSLWSQALEPLEDPAEHGITRAQVAQLVAQHYAAEYTAVFGASPADDAVDRVFANTGKALAAYERTLLPHPTRFDRYAEALAAQGSAAQILTAQEQAGLRLFIGQAGCINCHNGPLLTNLSFHNTGVPLAPGENRDRGRAEAIDKLLADPFNCLGEFSDAAPQDCAELRFLRAGGHELEGAFKPPSLRGAAAAPPYMHNGVFQTLEEVVDHYNRAPLAPVSHSEVQPLRLSARERAQLVAFLKTLSEE